MAPPRRDLGDRLADAARNELDYQWRSRVRRALPQWAHPLIPGEHGNLAQNAVRELERRHGGRLFAGIVGCFGAVLTGVLGLFGAVLAAVAKLFGG